MKQNLLFRFTEQKYAKNTPKICFQKKEYFNFGSALRLSFAKNNDTPEYAKNLFPKIKILKFSDINFRVIVVNFRSS